MLTARESHLPIISEGLYSIVTFHLIMDVEEDDETT